MKKFVEQLGNRYVLFFCFLAFTILCVLSNTVWHQNFTYLTQTFGYSVDYAKTLLTEIGPDGRMAHSTILISDFIMVILYCAYFIGANYKLSLRITSNCHLITILTFSPLLLGILQLAEIICDEMLLKMYPHNHDGFIQISSIITSVKIVITPIIFLITITLILIVVIKKVYGKRYEKQY